MSTQTRNDMLVHDTRNGLNRCISWTKWMHDAWAELQADPRIGSIANVELGWVADHRDRHAKCPICGLWIGRQT